MNKRATRRKACRHYKQHKQSCLLCSSVSTIKHHEDYNKPLNVIWLCKRCHSQYHNNKLNTDCVKLIKNCYRWFYIEHYVTYDWYIKNKATFPKAKNCIPFYISLGEKKRK